MIGGRSLLVASCTLAVLLAGCGGASHRDASTEAAATVAQAERETEAPPPPPKLAPNPWRKPGNLPPHPDAKVTRVIVRDLKKGSGPAVRPGDTVKVDYIEATYATGHRFMEAWGSRGPFSTSEVQLTPDVVMQGLIVGMRGMRPGGRRHILVPKRLSDVNDPDRAAYSYKKIVYYDVVLRAITARDGKPFRG